MAFIDRKGPVRFRGGHVWRRRRPAEVVVLGVATSVVIFFNGVRQDLGGHVEFLCQSVDRVGFDGRLVGAQGEPVIGDILHALIENDVGNAFALLVNASGDAFVKSVDRTRRLVR